MWKFYFLGRLQGNKLYGLYVAQTPTGASNHFTLHQQPGFIPNTCLFEIRWVRQDLVNAVCDARPVNTWKHLLNPTFTCHRACKWCFLILDSMKVAFYFYSSNIPLVTVYEQLHTRCFVKEIKFGAATFELDAAPKGPFYSHGYTLIPAWISNSIH